MLFDNNKFQSKTPRHKSTMATDYPEGVSNMMESAIRRKEFPQLDVTVLKILIPHESKIGVMVITAGGGETYRLDYDTHEGANARYRGVIHELRRIQKHSPKPIFGLGFVGNRIYRKKNSKREAAYTGPAYRDEEYDEEMAALHSVHYRDWLRDNADMFEDFPTLGVCIHKIEDKEHEKPVLAITTADSYRRKLHATEAGAEAAFEELAQGLRKVKSGSKLKAFWEDYGATPDSFHELPDPHTCENCCS
jgi:hypothetical protein